MAKTLLPHYRMSRLFGREGYDPFNKVSHEHFGRAKTLVTKYHMHRLFGMAKNLLTKFKISEDCLLGQRTF